MELLSLLVLAAGALGAYLAFFVDGMRQRGVNVCASGVSPSLDRWQFYFPLCHFQTILQNVELRFEGQVEFFLKLFIPGLISAGIAALVIMIFYAVISIITDTQ